MARGLFALLLLGAVVAAGGVVDAGGPVAAAAEPSASDPSQSVNPSPSPEPSPSTEPSPSVRPADPLPASRLLSAQLALTFPVSPWGSQSMSPTPGTRMSSLILSHTSLKAGSFPVSASADIVSRSGETEQIGCLFEHIADIECDPTLLFGGRAAAAVPGGTGPPNRVQSGPRHGRPAGPPSMRAQSRYLPLSRQSHRARCPPSHPPDGH